MHTLTYIVQSCHHLVSSITCEVFASSRLKFCNLVESGHRTLVAALSECVVIPHMVTSVVSLPFVLNPVLWQVHVWRVFLTKLEGLNYSVPLHLIVWIAIVSIERRTYLNRLWFPQGRTIPIWIDFLSRRTCIEFSLTPTLHFLTTSCSLHFYKRRPF